MPLGSRSTSRRHSRTTAGITANSASASVGLQAVGKPEKLVRPSCVTDGREYRVAHWSVAGLPLGPQTLTAVKIPDLGDPGEPVGVIGSDVWNRFGELRVAFRRGDLCSGAAGAQARRGP
jgi:hypothetical protein